MPENRQSRVLIVDDDEVILATTEALLAASGYEVSTHKGAFGASWLIMSTHPDLVLLDVKMPGLSGPDLAELIQRESGDKKVRIYFYSSCDDQILQEAVEETGADGYIRKGDRSELGAKVARALRG